MNIFLAKNICRRIAVIVFLLLPLLFSGCKKFLDQKRNKQDIIPNNLLELQRVLNSIDVINGRDMALPELVADNLYVTEADWQAMSASIEGQHYIWLSDAVPDEGSWSTIYGGPIFTSNAVLEQLPNVEFSSNEQPTFNAIKGSALFYRASGFLQVAQVFCKPYSADNAREPGIIVRTTAAIEVKSTRSTIQQTYDQITSDLLQAIQLLPEQTTFPSSPTKAAAYGMLARTYLFMREYAKAGKYADSALKQYNVLLDFNDLIPVGFPPIPTFNRETVSYSYAWNGAFTSDYVGKIDSTLYDSYHENDLRKEVFFVENFAPNEGTYAFRGSFNGTYAPVSIFTGISTGELYLVRAECLAREGKVAEAMADLNLLMKKRWNNQVTYPEITATGAADALNKVLTERRKELVFRGLRWSDIRRFNMDGAGITLKRVVGTSTYTLPPNDLRTVMLIPLTEIDRSGIVQNPR